MFFGLTGNGGRLKEGACLETLVVGATFEKVRADRRLDGIPRVRACGWRNGGAPGRGLLIAI